MAHAIEVVWFCCYYVIINKNCNFPVTTPTPIRCHNLPSVTNGIISDGNSEVGSIRFINCNSGYQLQGSSQIFCGQAGTWSLPGSCTIITTLPPIRCGSLPTIWNGFVANGGSDVGSARNIYCNSGYQLQGNSQIFCAHNGVWSSPGSCTVITTPAPIRCNSLPTVANGRIASGNSEVGSARNVSCNSGYQLQGNSQIFCGRTGTWSSPGSCTVITTRAPIRCNSLPTVANGRISSGNSYVGSTRTVNCNSGYQQKIPREVPLVISRYSTRGVGELFAVADLTTWQLVWLVNNWASVLTKSATVHH